MSKPTVAALATGRLMWVSVALIAGAVALTMAATMTSANSRFVGYAGLALGVATVVGLTGKIGVRLTLGFAVALVYTMVVPVLLPLSTNKPPSVFLPIPNK